MKLKKNIIPPHTMRTEPFFVHGLTSRTTVSLTLLDSATDTIVTVHVYALKRYCHCVTTWTMVLPVRTEINNCYIARPLHSIGPMGPATMHNASTFPWIKGPAHTFLPTTDTVHQLTDRPATLTPPTWSLALSLKAVTLTHNLYLLARL